MADLIDRAAAIEAIESLMQRYREIGAECDRDGAIFSREAIKKLPAVDAVPVVHGRWVNKNEEGVYGPAYCSVCDFELRIDDTPYCPMCSAKMDGDNNG